MLQQWNGPDASPRREIRTCPACGSDASNLEPYEVGSGPELACPACDWAWGLFGQLLLPVTNENIAALMATAKFRSR